MKFLIEYKVGDEIRTKNIIAKNLDEAEEKANSLFKKWINIYNQDFKKGNDYKKEK